MFLTLFLRELRRSLFATPLVLAGTLAGLVVVEHAYPAARRLFPPADETPFSLTTLIPFLLVICSFGLGARTFSRRLKETHSLFLMTLPLNRNWIWVALVAPRLLALLVSIPLVVGLLALSLKPVLFEYPPEASGAVVAWCCISFAAGLCAATLFRRTLFVYLCGGLLSLAFAQQLILTVVPLVDVKEGGVIRIASVALVFLALSSGLFFISCRSFIAGDFHHTRRRLRNWVFAAFVCVTIFGFFQSRRIIELLSGSRWDVLIAEASGDGRFLAVVEMLHGRVRINRLLVYDVESGRCVLERPLSLVDWHFWTAKSKVLAVFSSTLPAVGILRLMPGQYLIEDVMDRVFVDSMRVDRTRFPGAIHDVAAYGDQLLLRRPGTSGESSVSSLDPVTGEERELLRIKMNGYGSLYDFGHEIVIDSPNWYVDGNAGQAWILGAELREIRSTPFENAKDGPFGPVDGSYTVLDTVYRTPERAGEGLRRAFAIPQPWNGLEAGNAECFVVTGDSRRNTLFVGAGTAVFYLRSRPDGGDAQLYLYRRTDSSWQPLATVGSLKPGSLPLPLPLGYPWIDGELGPWPWDPPQRLRNHLHLDVRPIEGVIAYLDADQHSSMAKLYDVALGKELEVGEVFERSSNQSSVTIHAIVGNAGLLVAIQPRSSVAHWKAFQYTPASAQLQPLPSLDIDPADLLFLDPTGRRIQRIPGSGTIESVDAGGRRRVLRP